MKKKRLTTKVVVLALGVACLAAIMVIKAQSTPSSSARITTNWIGYIAFGKKDSTDQINREPFPATDAQVQIGLRSDGVVVWRSTPHGN